MVQTSQERSAMKTAITLSWPVLNSSSFLTVPYLDIYTTYTVVLWYYVLFINMFPCLFCPVRLMAQIDWNEQ